MPTFSLIRITRLPDNAGKITGASVNTKTAYKKLMGEILALMNKGEQRISKTESVKLRAMTIAAQAYEDSIDKIPQPSTLGGIIELKMYERKLKQKDMAKLMGLSESKFSQILSGKRSPDISFLKAAHQKLGIDASFLLNYV